jgi:hypothetical protein
MTPQRIQLSRKKGFRLPLNAKSVARPSKWGNKWRVIRRGGTWDIQTPGGGYLCRIFRDEAVAEAVQYHREWVTRMCESNRDFLRLLRADLRGRDLACYCAPGTPCHADVLLELANA